MHCCSPLALVARAVLAGALAVGCVGLASPGAQATTLFDQSVAQLTASAERIVIARVTGVRSFAEHAKGLQIFTEAQLSVVESLKGTGPAQFALRQLGGTAGEGSQQHTQSVPGMPAWREGEVVVLFLEHTDTRRLVTSALSMGKYTLSPGEGGRVMARRDVGQLNRLGMRRAPDKFFLGAVRSEDSLSLDELRALIAGKRLLAFPKVVRPVDPSVAPLPRVPASPGASGGEVAR